MLNQNINYQPLYNSLPIQFYPSGVHGEILNAVYDHLIDMKNRHCKVFYLRADIRFPDNGIQYPQGNDFFEPFIADYVKAIRRKCIDVAYVWTREQDTSINHHYHLCLFFDGNKIQHHKNVLDIAERIWANKLSLDSSINNGLVHFCTTDTYGNYIDNGIMLIRNSHDEQNSFARIIFSASYLAKTYSKGSVMPGVRQFNHSRFPNKLSSPAPFDSDITYESI